MTAEGLEKLGAIMRRVFDGIAEYHATPEGRADADRRASLYLRLKAREAKERADVAGVPDFGEIREQAMNPQLAWDSVALLRVHLADRANRSRRGRAPALAVLCGPKGCGKTTALSWAVIQSDRGSCYATASEICETKNWGEGAASWKRWLNTDTLAIDELGIESDVETIQKLFLHRWERTAGLTVCASNLSVPDTSERFFTGLLGERLDDRLVTQEAPVFLEITGPTRRERAAMRGAR